MAAFYKIMALQQKTYSHFERERKFLEIFLSRLRFKKVMKYIPDNARILDLGCGFYGDFLLRIKDKISSGVGIDISVNKTINNHKIKLLKHNLDNPLPFNDNQFDIAVSLANLEHLNNPQQMFNEIYRVLNKKGILLLTTPSIYAKPVLEFLALKLKVIDEQEVMHHKFYFNKRSLCAYCRNTGFSFYAHSYFQFFMNNFLYAKK